VAEAGRSGRGASRGRRLQDAVAVGVGVRDRLGPARVHRGVGPRERRSRISCRTRVGSDSKRAIPSSRGDQRVYRNYGIDLWSRPSWGKIRRRRGWRNRGLRSLGMSSTALKGRPARRRSSTNDLATLAVAWLRPDGLSNETRGFESSTVLARTRRHRGPFWPFSRHVRGGGPEVRVRSNIGWATGPRRVLVTLASGR